MTSETVSVDTQAWKRYISVAQLLKSWLVIVNKQYLTEKGKYQRPPLALYSPIRLRDGRYPAVGEVEARTD